MLDQVDRLGRDRERADRFVVAGVADVEDRVALAGAHLRLVVHLGDERAHRVDDVATLRARGGDDLGRGAVRREHERRAGRHLVDVVDEDHALLPEPLDDEPVVHDLVVAVHGRLEGAHHPRQRLDRHLDAGAEAARLGEQDRLHAGRAGGIDRHRRPTVQGGDSGFGPVDLRDAPRTSSRRRARIPGCRRGRRRGRRGPGGQRRGSPRRHRVPAARRRPACRARSAAGRARAARRGRQGRRRAARSRARERGVRPGAHLRQPLPVLLHLPAPEGDAEEPLPEGRRLPAVVPLRKLHDAHPLHRGRPRAGGHRAARSALRQHPRDRSRRAHPLAAQPARRDEPALARAAARRGRRGARPGRRVPGDQRRRGARRHAARRARPLPDARDGRRRAARRERAQPRAGDAPAHRGRSRGRRRHDRALAGAATAPRSAAGSCSPPTSTTSSRGGRSRRSTRTTTSPSTRTASAWRARSKPRCAPRWRVPTCRAPASAAGFFAWVDGAPADGYRAPRARTRPHRIGGSDAPLRGRHRTRRSRSSPASSARGCSRRSCPSWPGRRASCSPVENRFFGGNIGVTGLLTGRRRRTRPRRRSPPAAATSCPTSCCRAVASSTARRVADLPAPGRDRPDRRRVARAPRCRSHDRA